MMELVQRSVQGGLLILVILLVRAPALRRLPKWSLTALWDLALLRLLMPVELPFRWSVYTLLQRAMLSAAPLPDAAPSPVPREPTEPLAGGTVAAAAGGVPIWAVLWLAGATVAALYFVIAYRLHRRAFRSAVLVENDFTRAWLARHKLRRAVTILQSERVFTPLTYGVLRPVLVLPAGLDWTDTAALTCAFTHEWTHIRRFDALRRFLLVAALCLHWFNPLVWVLYRQARRDMELVCDEAAVRRLGVDNRRAYALALLAMEERRLRVQTFSSAFGENIAEERLRAVMRVRKPSLRRGAAALALLLCVFALFGTGAAALPADTPAAETTAPADSVFADWELRHMTAHRLRCGGGGLSETYGYRWSLPVARVNAGWELRIRLNCQCTYGDGTVEYALVNRTTGDLYPNPRVDAAAGARILVFTAPTSGSYSLLVQRPGGDGKFSLSFGTVVTLDTGEKFYVSGSRCSSETRSS